MAAAGAALCTALTRAITLLNFFTILATYLALARTRMIAGADGWRDRPENRHLLGASQRRALPFGKFSVMNTGKVVRFRSRDQILTRRMAHVFVEDIRKILYGGVPSPTKASSSTWEALRRLKDHDEQGADLAIIAALAALPAKQHDAIGPLWAALDALEIQDENAAVAALDKAWAVLERDRLRDCAS